MTYERPTRRFDVDEQASLERVGEFTRDEVDGFSDYCAALYRLGDISGVVSAGAARSHTCTACRRAAPAGLPTGWVGSKWDLCPACVRAKRLIAYWADGRRRPGAIDQELDRLSPEDERGEAAAFFAAVARWGSR
jgi:hypothetical protein